jgi:hypothetical protein
VINRQQAVPSSFSPGSTHIPSLPSVTGRDRHMGEQLCQDLPRL